MTMKEVSKHGRAPVAQSVTELPAVLYTVRVEMYHT
jgi:hypothetical protein